MRHAAMSSRRPWNLGSLSSRAVAFWIRGSFTSATCTQGGEPGAGCSQRRMELGASAWGKGEDEGKGELVQSHRHLWPQPVVRNMSA